MLDDSTKAGVTSTLSPFKSFFKTKNCKIAKPDSIESETHAKAVPTLAKSKSDVPSPSSAIFPALHEDDKIPLKLCRSTTTSGKGKKKDFFSKSKELLFSKSTKDITSETQNFHETGRILKSIDNAIFVVDGQEDMTAVTKPVSGSEYDDMFISNPSITQKDISARSTILFIPEQLNVMELEKTSHDGRSLTRDNYDELLSRVSRTDTEKNDRSNTIKILPGIFQNISVDNIQGLSQASDLQRFHIKDGSATLQLSSSPAPKTPLPASYIPLKKPQNLPTIKMGGSSVLQVENKRKVRQLKKSAIDTSVFENSISDWLPKYETENEQDFSRINDTGSKKIDSVISTTPTSLLESSNNKGLVETDCDSNSDYSKIDTQNSDLSDKQFSFISEEQSKRAALNQKQVYFN